MKRFSILFALVCLFVFTSCEEDQLERCGAFFGEVEGSSFELVELPMTELADGFYPASIGSRKLFVVVTGEKVQWIMPRLKDGTYTLSISGDGVRHKAIVHVVPRDGANF